MKGICVSAQTRTEGCCLASTRAVDARKTRAESLILLDIKVLLQLIFLLFLILVFRTRSEISRLLNTELITAQLIGYCVSFKCIAILLSTSNFNNVLARCPVFIHTLMVILYNLCGVGFTRRCPRKNAEG